MHTEFPGSAEPTYYAMAKIAYLDVAFQIQFSVIHSTEAPGSWHADREVREAAERERLAALGCELLIFQLISERREVLRSAAEDAPIVRPQLRLVGG